jgi:hypothetical protein
MAAAVLASMASPLLCQPTPAKVRVPTVRVVSSGWSAARMVPGSVAVWSSVRRKVMRVSRRSLKVTE